MRKRGKVQKLRRSQAVIYCKDLWRFSRSRKFAACHSIAPTLGQFPSHIFLLQNVFVNNFTNSNEIWRSLKVYEMYTIYTLCINILVGIYCTNILEVIIVPTIGHAIFIPTYIQNSLLREIYRTDNLGTWYYNYGVYPRCT